MPRYSTYANPNYLAIASFLLNHQPCSKEFMVERMDLDRRAIGMILSRAVRRGEITHTDKGYEFTDRTLIKKLTPYLLRQNNGQGHQASRFSTL